MDFESGDVSGGPWGSRHMVVGHSCPTLTVVRRSPDLARASTAGLKGVPQKQAEHGDRSGQNEWLGQETGHN
jgi:hypothetical protein